MKHLEDIISMLIDEQPDEGSGKPRHHPRQVQCSEGERSAFITDQAQDDLSKQHSSGPGLSSRSRNGAQATSRTSTATL